MIPRIRIALGSRSVVRGRLVFLQAYGAMSTHRQFGSSEGGRSDLEDPLKDFITFTQRRFRSGIGMSRTDRTARVLVGRKGAGKTLYLRRLQAAASTENSLYADAWREDLFPTRDVILIWDWSTGGQDALERWELIWRRAIFRAAISHLLNRRELRDLIGEYGAPLRAQAGTLYPKLETPMSISSQVEAIIAEHRISRVQSSRPLDEYLRRPEWGPVQHALEEALDNCRPMCFYVDGVDNRFTAAPMQWLPCQEGLFNAVMALMGERLGSRLHVIIGIRDLVFSSALQKESQGKLAGSEYIRTLEWDFAAIRQFLFQRIESLAPEYWLAPDAIDRVEQWLGMSTIVNVKRKLSSPERLEHYLLRHTRLIPRDVVLLGNALCDLIDQSEESGELLMEDIRRVVAQEAAGFANEELLSVANHITARLMPHGAGVYEFFENYTGDDEDEYADAMQQDLRKVLKRLIGTLNRDRFSNDVLQRFRIEAAETIGGPIDLPAILWQHGLIGHTENVMNGEATFFATARELSMELPEARGYALHPILLDIVTDLKSVGAVVYPYRPPEVPVRSLRA
jgi:hypothetical protein